MENKLVATQTKTSLEQHTENSLPVFTNCNLTPFQASKGQQLSALKKEKGKEYLKAVIALQMNTALKMLPSNPSTPEAVVMAAEMIVDRFWMMKLDEIFLAFKRGVLGQYGKIYGLVSLNYFFDWINAYNQEQAGEHSEVANEREKQEWNKKIDGTMSDAEVFGKLVDGGKVEVEPNRIGKMRSIKDILTFKK